MVFFGNDLLKKGVISKQDLVGALVTQSDQLHSPIRIAFEEDLLTPKQIFDVIMAKTEGESFSYACKRMGFWDSTIEQSVADKQKKDRKPLGQILVEDHGIDLSIISMELASSNPGSKPVETSEIKDTVDIASEFGFTFPQVSGETKKQYLEFFSSEVKDEVGKLFQNLEESNDKETVRSLEETIQQITAAASFARMEISFTVSDKLSQLVDQIKEKGVVSFRSLDELKTVCLTSLDVLWELHRFIDVSGSEEEFWANEISKANFSTAMNGLNSLLAPS